MKSPNVDPGLYSVTELNNFLDQIKSKIGTKNYNTSTKFLILHHPIHFLNRRNDRIENLKDKGIEIIFSGHYHKSDYWENLSLKNFIVGSILVKAEERIKYVFGSTQNPEFNYYEFNMENNTFSQDIYYNENLGGKWLVRHYKSLKYYNYKNRNAENFEYEIEHKAEFLEILNSKLSSIFNEIFNNEKEVDLDDFEDFIQQIEETLIFEINDVNKLIFEQKSQLCKYAEYKGFSTEFLSWYNLEELIETQACNGLYGISKKLIYPAINELEIVCGVYDLDIENISMKNEFISFKISDLIHLMKNIDLYKYKIEDKEIYIYELLSSYLDLKFYIKKILN